MNGNGICLPRATFNSSLSPKSNKFYWHNLPTQTSSESFFSVLFIITATTLNGTFSISHWTLFTLSLLPTILLFRSKSFCPLESPGDALKIQISDAHMSPSQSVSGWDPGMWTFRKLTVDLFCSQDSGSICTTLFPSPTRSCHLPSHGNVTHSQVVL